MKYVCTHEQIQEWRQRIGYISSHLVKKTFEYSTQFYPGVSHEGELMPKKSAVEIFPAMPDSLCGFCRNKETFSVDAVGNTYLG